MKVNRSKTALSPFSIRNVSATIARNLKFTHICNPNRQKVRWLAEALVAELVDAHDSKSCTVRCAGSIPA